VQEQPALALLDALLDELLSDRHDDVLGFGADSASCGVVDMSRAP